MHVQKRTVTSLFLHYKLVGSVGVEQMRLRTKSMVQVPIAKPLGQVEDWLITCTKLTKVSKIQRVSYKIKISNDTLQRLK